MQHKHIQASRYKKTLAVFQVKRKGKTAPQSIFTQCIGIQ